MRSTIGALLLLALVGCEHTPSKKSDEQPPPSKPAAQPAQQNEPAKQPAAAPIAADPNAVRPPVAADLAEYLKQIQGEGTLVATFETSNGTIHCELFEKQAPMTVANFVGLATGQKPWLNPKTGETTKAPYFDGLTFHRVIPEFMIQGGDPLGVGRGGPGYNFQDEFVSELRMQPGTLAMANAGPATNGSQFFINEVATDHLNGKHTIFGQCKEVDVVKQIARVPAEGGNRPTTPVTMKVTVGRMKSW